MAWASMCCASSWFPAVPFAPLAVRRDEVVQAERRTGRRTSVAAAVAERQVRSLERRMRADVVEEEVEERLRGLIAGSGGSSRTPAPVTPDWLSARVEQLREGRGDRRDRRACCSPPAPVAGGQVVVEREPWPRSAGGGAAAAIGAGGAARTSIRPIEIAHDLLGGRSGRRTADRAESWAPAAARLPGTRRVVRARPPQPAASGSGAAARVAAGEPRRPGPVRARPAADLVRRDGRRGARETTAGGGDGAGRAAQWAALRAALRAAPVRRRTRPGERGGALLRAARAAGRRARRGGARRLGVYPGRALGGSRRRCHGRGHGGGTRGRLDLLVDLERRLRIRPARRRRRLPGALDQAARKSVTRPTRSR